ncbi:MAG: alpha/beta fold hydrolase [Candidatus Heimdallarchaeota archaeon]|nr:alpha/beta fold hydrolase [Candidatus Heimdallarchaeota archaeon]
MNNSNTESNYQQKKMPLSDDQVISYYSYLNGKEITLVFIHGLGGSKENFLPVFSIKELIKYNILVPDLIGHGDSSTPNDFSYEMDAQAELLAQFLNQLPITEQIIIIAHSMGGPIGLKLAERLHNNIKGIVYAEGNIDENDCTFSKIIINEYTENEWKKMGFYDFLTNFKTNPEMNEYAKTFAQAGPLTIYKSSIDLYKLSKEEKLLERLVKMKVPVLAIYGEQNKGRFSSERKLRRVFPVKYIPKAGHAMMLDNPQAFYKIINEFIEHK